MKIPFILLLLTSTIYATWGENGKRKVTMDTSSFDSETIDSTFNSPYLKSLKIIGDSVIVGDKLYYIKNNDKIDYYRLGKIISRKDSPLYQNGYIPRVLVSGIVFPIGGPILLNKFKREVKPIFVNDFNLSQDDFEKLKSGYNYVHQKKRILKSAGLGAIGSLIGMFLYFYIVIIVSEIQNPAPMN